MRKVKIPPDFTVIEKCRTQSGATDNIYLKDTCFTPYILEHPIETSIHNPIVAPENNNNMLMVSQSKPRVHEGLASEEASSSEFHKFTVSERVFNILKPDKVGFTENPFGTTSEIPSCKGDKISKILKMIDIASTSINIYTKLDNNTK